MHIWISVVGIFINREVIPTFNRLHFCLDFNKTQQTTEWVVWSSFIILKAKQLMFNTLQQL